MILKAHYSFWIGHLKKAHEVPGTRLQISKPKNSLN